VTADIHGDAASLTPPPSSISSASAARSRSRLARQKTPVGLVGHTHRPAIACLDEGGIHYGPGATRLCSTRAP
jgi:hypothetical protein